MLGMPDDVVTAEVLARWLGISDRSVRELAKRGIVARRSRLRLRSRK
jgi:hypothetical protein